MNSKRCSFRSDRKWRVVHNGTVCNWMMASKGTSQGSVSGPRLFSLFLGDLETDSNLDDTIPLYWLPWTNFWTTPRKRLHSFWIGPTIIEWNVIRLNVRSQLLLRKKCNNSIYPEVFHIKQYDHVTLLIVTFQSNCEFSGHVKSKLCEADKCLFVIRGLRNEGYGQKDVDLLFISIVLSKLTHGLSIFGASKADLVVMDCFPKR